MATLTRPMELCKNIIGGDGWRAGHLHGKTGAEYMKEGMLCCEFDNLSAMIGVARTLVGKERWNGVKKRGDDSDQDNDDGWTESDNVSEAIDRMRNTPQFYNNFTEQEGKLFSEETSGNVVQYHTDGEFLDVSRYLENDPECFGSTHYGLPTIRLVTINVDLSQAFFVKKGTIARRNAWLCALVDYLENNNVRCRVRGIGSTEVAHVEVMVKDFHETLNINNVAAVSSSDFLRRIVFLFDEFSPTWDFGYGSSDRNVWHKQPDPDAELTLAMRNLNGHSKHDVDVAFTSLFEKFNNGEMFDNEKYLTPTERYLENVL